MFFKGMEDGLRDIGWMVGGVLKCTLWLTAKLIVVVYRSI